MQKNMILVLCLSLMTSLAFAGAGALPTVRVEAIKKANEAAEKKAELDKLLEDSGALSKLQKAFADNKNNKEALEIATLQYEELKLEINRPRYLNHPELRSIYIQNSNNLAEMNYQFTKCNASKNEQACNKYDRLKDLAPSKGINLSEIKKIQIPKIDSKNGTYSVNGEMNSIHSKDKKEFKAAEAKTTQTAKSEDSTYECDWSDSFPRKILHGPGCKSEGTRICAGYVSCKSNGRQIDRLATCSDTLCGEGQATQCALQKGYGSMTANPINGSAKSSADQNSNSGNNNQ